MEFVEGGEVTDKNYMTKNGISRQEISHRLGLLYSEMIFIQVSKFKLQLISDIINRFQTIFAKFLGKRAL